MSIMPQQSQANPGKQLATALIVGAICGAAIALLVIAANTKPSAQSCLDVCKGANASTFYAADGACLCVPACPACPACTQVVAPAEPLTPGGAQ